MANCYTRNDSTSTKIVLYIKDYYSFNFQIIPKAKVEYLGLETEKTTTMGKNRYDVTDSARRVSCHTSPSFSPSIYVPRAVLRICVTCSFRCILLLLLFTSTAHLYNKMKDRTTYCIDGAEIFKLGEIHGRSC